MGENSKIEWCHHTFNPWIGCTKVSAGCANCYAERDFDKRRHFAQWGVNGARVVTKAANWAKPLKWNREAAERQTRERVFCASLADVFEGPESMPKGLYSTVRNARVRLFQLIEQTPNLDWLLLTKRPERVNAMVDEIYHDCLVRPGDPWERLWNVWIGASVESHAVDHRIEQLLKIPALIRFLSVEPLIEELDLGLRNWAFVERDDCRLDWVIVGGESGPNARPMHPDWVRLIRDDCNEVGMHFFFKQWGEWYPLSQDAPHGQLNPDLKTCEAHGERFVYLNKHDAGRMLDGREWNEFPTPLLTERLVTEK